ncbi:MAG: ECF transporter S component [Clostridiales bacterium]|nr:ECF transporter S component [Clostridiales bacterium]
MINASKKRVSLRTIAKIGILAAVSFVLMFIEVVVFPAVPFYKLDISQSVVMIGGFALGPVAAVIINFIKSLLHLTVSSSAGVGEIADFITGICLTVPAAIIYKRKKTRGRALIGMGVGIITMTIAAVLANYYILLPFFSAMFNIDIANIVAMGTKMFPSVDTVFEFLLLCTAPFNIIKGIVCSFVCYLLYKRVSKVLHV